MPCKCIGGNITTGLMTGGVGFPRFPEYEIHYYQFLAAAQQVFELFAEVLAAMRQRGLWLKKNPDRRPHQPLWLRQLRQPRGRLFGSGFLAAGRLTKTA